ncbi:MAG: hypothetical protein KKE61_07125, partial [Proteobacteria bacterium]|nr:hypothetical protein [Pseudomonadota bacterium]
VGRFSPPILSCMRSWGRNSHKVGFVCIDGDMGLKPCSRYLDIQMNLPQSEVYKNNGISRISRFLKRFDADVLSCIDDNIACWLSDNAFQLDNKISVAFPSSQMIKKILSKAQQNAIATKVGLKVLPEYLIDNDNIERISIAPEHFPMCLRPSAPHDVTPFFKVKLVHSTIELKQFIQTIHITQKIIGQPFKNLPNLVIHGIRSQNGDTKLMSAFMIQRKFEGVTLTLQPYPDLPEELIDKCTAFVQSFDLIGNFHFEFLFDPETSEAFFLEINLRFGGTTAKVLACGYDEPMYALEAFGIVKSYGKPVVQDIVVTNKQAILKYIGKALKNSLTELDYPNESVWERIFFGIKGFFRFKDEVMTVDDIRGSVSLYGNNAINIFKKIF